mmetsp:Transcript_78188/g.253827  ORF Transcript_78188/g.253827 Transcript_78188/m.253827 type:complete len:298 (-) Transcript_78188:15-908(-)
MPRDKARLADAADRPMKVVQVCVRVRDQATGGLVTEEAVEECRDPSRATDVCCDAHGRAENGHGCARAATGASWRSRAIEGAIRASVHQVVALHPHACFRNVAAADDDEAPFQDALHDRAVPLTESALQGQQAVGVWLPNELERFLQHDRHAQKLGQAFELARSLRIVDPSIGAGRLVPSLRKSLPRQSVQRVMRALEHFNRCLNDVHSMELLAANRPCQPARRPAQEFGSTFGNDRWRRSVPFQPPRQAPQQQQRCQQGDALREASMPPRQDGLKRRRHLAHARARASKGRRALPR